MNKQFNTPEERQAYMDAYYSEQVVTRHPDGSVTIDTEKATRMVYRGPEACTRGEYGERITHGYMDREDMIYVFDSATGWIPWGYYRRGSDQEWYLDV